MNKIEILKLETVIAEVRDEYNRATAKFGPFKSGHEGYAVILEEMDELWEGVKNNDSRNMKEEVVQIAAMAIRFYVDVIKKQETVNESAN